MKFILSLCFFLICTIEFYGQQTPFEKSNGTETTTYNEAISYYKSLRAYHSIKIIEMGETDAGYPLHLVLLSVDNHFDPEMWHRQHKVVMLINNGIHPGEPDGIDASMMLARDIVSKKVTLPSNVVIAIIPVYNIGGSLNRNSFSRVNQNGPLSYGFRGNEQNLDLNRDFTKNDSRNSRAFVKIFHFINPDILIDNHVSDGADYQHTMTLITTQYDKLGGPAGAFLKESFEPALYKSMSMKGWDMVPYVNFETSNPQKGMEQFYDQPRYSSGYAALFQTYSFMPETHMLKPFSDRVKSTYALMNTMIEEASAQAAKLLDAREQSIQQVKMATAFPLSWVPDSLSYTQINFKGYEQGYKLSNATGLQSMYYDHTKPFTKKVNYFNHFLPVQITTKPKAYIIPKGWWAIIDILKLNSIVVDTCQHDTTMVVSGYRIEDFKSYSKAYEKHHKNYNTRVAVTKQTRTFAKGDYIIFMNQKGNRYLEEMLEPAGDDSFFSWNFFDAILQQKEGYSDYRWESIAAEVLKTNPKLKLKLDAKKADDPVFANSSSAILDFIYKNSPYYEPAHLQYPVYRLE